MAVRIRMKPMGRKHRPYYRIVAIDSRQPNDGRDLEILGTYDPMVKQADKQVTLQVDRVKYWQSVGAKVSEKVASLLKRHMANAAPAPAPTAATPKS